jgi:translation initiation factor 1
VKSKFGGLVYSTDQGRLCSECGQAMAACICHQIGKDSIPKGDGVVRVYRETKGRKGKGVTLISGVPIAEDALIALAKKLKQKCGTGGTVKNHVIEIQGDQRDIIVAELSAQGFKVKKAGG